MVKGVFDKSQELQCGEIRDWVVAPAGRNQLVMDLEAHDHLLIFILSSQFSQTSLKTFR